METYRSPLVFLLEASEILGSSLESESTLKRLAQFVAGAFADWCTIYLLDESERLKLIAVAHRDPEKSARAERFLEVYPPSPEMEGGVYQIVATCRPVIYPVVREEHIEAFARDAEHRRQLDAIGFTSAMVVPLVVRGKGVGAIHFAATEESGKVFGTADLVVAEELARRVAVAIDNASLYRQAQEALERLNIALDAGEMGAWEIDLKSDEVVLSPRMAQLLGLESGEMRTVYRRFLEIVHPDDREKLSLERAATMDFDALSEVEFRVTSKSGAHRWMILKGKVTHADADGTPARIAGICIDVTRQKASEAALRGATARLRAIIRASPLPVISMDLQGRVNDWNPAAERMTGWKRREVLGRCNPMLPAPPDDRDDELFARLRQGETIEGVVVRRRRRDGTFIDLSKWASPLEGDDGTIQGFVAIYNDVTDRLRFLQVASHELGNPLSSIRALQSLMRMHISQGAPAEKLLSDLDRMQAEMDRFTSLFREIIETFQAHQRKLSFKPTRLDVQALVRECAARWPGIDHQVHFKGGAEPAWVEGDPRRLEQVLTNLLSNAAKYSPQGSPIEIETKVGDGCVQISVTDYGIGIPEVEIPRIFDEFHRVEGVSDDRAVDGTEGGIGLGLFVCREIVRQHGGRIWVESELHKGSTFYVQLPLASAGRSEAASTRDV